jgi:hypothetical protein
MAELAPWLASEEPAATAGQVAPWLAQEPMPGYAEDMAKGAVAGTGQGIIAIPGAPGDMQSLIQAGANKFGNPFKFLSEKFSETELGRFLKEESFKTLRDNSRLANSGDMLGGGDIRLPTSADIQKQVEKVTGPFYEAKTGPGKAVQTATQIAPSLLTGGQTIPGAIIKAGAGGVASELAGEGAAAAKHLLPEGAQPWAEPVARAVGAVGGTLTPAGARRAITPLPMSNERLATVQALRNSNPELVRATSAGQLTESPRVMAGETRSPRMADLPERQAEAYTRGVMRQAGSNGLFDTAGLAEARNTGAQLDALRNANRMSIPEFAALNQDIAAMGRRGSDLFRAVGPSKPFEEIRKQVAGGPTGGNPVPFDMTGQRYGALKQILHTASESAPTTHEARAIAAARERMNQAFHSSMPADEAARLQNLDRQYSNYKTIENIPVRPGERTVTPQQVSSKATRGSDLDVHAEHAAPLMRPLPAPTHEISPLAQQTSAIVNSAIHGGAGYGMGGGLGALTGAGEGYLGGLFGAESAINAAKNALGRGVALPSVQEYLKNQRWRPGPHSSAPDREMLLRLLMTPEAKGAGPRSE